VRHSKHDALNLIRSSLCTSTGDQNAFKSGGFPNLLTRDVDLYDRPFDTGARTYEGFYVVKKVLEPARPKTISHRAHAAFQKCAAAPVSSISGQLKFRQPDEKSAKP
jgi:hypothetical protein